MPSSLSALILAAGFSSRMGDLKALLPLGGPGSPTLLEQCVELFRDSGIDPVVVTGYRAEEVGPAAAKAGAHTVYNKDFACGMYSSIRTGARHLRDRCRGFFLLPVDIPLIRCGTIKLLQRAATRFSADILYPVFDERRGHPPLLSASLIPAIITQENPAGGLRELLRRIEAEHPERVGEVPVADAHIHLDLDTRAALLDGRWRMTRRDIPSRMECEVILQRLHPIPEKGLAHGRLVAAVAVAIAEAIVRCNGQELDTELCRAGGLLHDIAKGREHHESTGAAWMRDLGFDRVAAIIAAHKDLDWIPGMALGEREIVHLADKIVRGDRIVPLEKRFGDKLILYRDDPEAVRAIGSRYEKAVQLATLVESLINQPITAIGKAASLPCTL